jgi:hypothetical protein
MFALRRTRGEPLSVVSAFSAGGPGPESDIPCCSTEGLKVPVSGTICITRKEGATFLAVRVTLGARTGDGRPLLLY